MTWGGSEKNRWFQLDVCDQYALIVSGEKKEGKNVWIPNLY